jgi:hypothetical protein
MNNPTLESIAKEPFKRDIRGRVIWFKEDNARLAAAYVLKNLGYDLDMPREKKVQFLEQITEYKSIITPKHNGATGFLCERANLAGLLNHSRAYMDYVKSSPLEFFKWLDPTILDTKEQHHVHEWDLSMNYWDDKHYDIHERKIRNAVQHMFEEKLGYSSIMSPEEKVETFRSMFEYKNSGEGGALKYCYNVLKLRGLMSIKRSYLENVTGSHHALLKWFFEEDKETWKLIEEKYYKGRKEK